MSKTSLEWWNEVRKDSNKLIDWLKSQYHGEATAAKRIREFSDKFCQDPQHKKTLALIAHQEETHATWVGELLISRGMAPEILAKQARYWNVTLPDISDFEHGSAVAAHAEEMRLHRIRIIVEHPETPEDIRAVFARILPEEMFHQRAFASMAGTDALENTRSKHHAGMNALGLVS